MFARLFSFFRNNVSYLAVITRFILVVGDERQRWPLLKGIFLLLPCFGQLLCPLEKME